MKSFFADFWNFNRRETIKIMFWNVISSFTAGIGVVMLVPMLSVLELSTDQSGFFGAILAPFANMPKMTVVAILLGIFIVLVSFKSLVSAKLSVWTAALIADYTRHLRLKTHEAITLADWQKYKTYKKTELEDYMLSETGRISSAEYYLVHIVNLVITAIVNIIIALCMNVLMTVLVIICGGIAFFAFRKIRGISRKFGQRLQDANARLLEEIDNQLNGVKEIRSYGVERKQRDIYWQVEEEQYQAGLQYTKLMTIPTLILNIGSAVLVAAFFLLSYFVMHMSIARIAVLIYVFSRLWPCVSTGQNYIQQIHTCMPVYENLNKVLADLKENQHVCAQGEEDQIPFEEKMELKDVSFHYSDSEDGEEILKHLNFEIRKGETTAFVGRSGAGKSTLVDMCRAS